MFAGEGSRHLCPRAWYNLQFDSIHNIKYCSTMNRILAMCDIGCPPEKMCYDSDRSVGCVIGEARVGDTFHEGACCEADNNVSFVGTVRAMLDFARTVPAPNHVVVGNRRALRELLATNSIQNAPSFFSDKTLFLSTTMEDDLPDPQFTETMVDDLFQLKRKLMPAAEISVSVTPEDLRRQSLECRRADTYTFTIPLMHLSNQQIPMNILTLAKDSVYMFGDTDGCTVVSRILRALATREPETRFNITVMCTGLDPKISSRNVSMIRGAMVITDFRGEIGVEIPDLFNSNVNLGARDVTADRRVFCGQDEMVLTIDR